MLAATVPGRGASTERAGPASAPVKAAPWSASPARVRLAPRAGERLSALMAKRIKSLPQERGFVRRRRLRGRQPRLEPACPGRDPGRARRRRAGRAAHPRAGSGDRPEIRAACPRDPEPVPLAGSGPEGRRLIDRPGLSARCPRCGQAAFGGEIAAAGRGAVRACSQVVSGFSTRWWTRSATAQARTSEAASIGQ